MTDESLLGAFARIFHVRTAGELADAFRAHGLTQIQLNLSTFGLPTIPTETEVSTDELRRFGQILSSPGLDLWGVSATYNTAHPEERRRREGTRRAGEFISRLGPLGVAAATLCSGSRDPENMWGFHPETATEDAWRDFRASLDELLIAAEAGGVTLAIEPEPANTVADVDRALRLQHELGSDAARIGFILDPANLIADVGEDDHRYTLERAFAELGDRTVCVHAKDTVPWHDALEGRGVVDYDLVVALHEGLPRPTPLIIQDASEEELPRVIDLLRDARLRASA